MEKYWIKERERERERERDKERDLHMAFIDLEKVYDRAPREILWKLSNKKGPTSYIFELLRICMMGCNNCKNSRRSNRGFLS